MAIYRISDILNSISDMKDDGFEYVDISIVESDNKLLETLYLEAIISEDARETDMIDSVILPNGYCLNL